MSLNECIALRHYLHRYPEVSQEERKTHGYLSEKLDLLQPDLLQTVAGTGILVIFNGRENGKNILFRADIDALPIAETIDADYRSVSEAVSHKCGHDGHTAILYGLAKHFAAERPGKGDVYLLFQPAEENGWGARAVRDSMALGGLTIDYAVALHNLPGFPLHQIVCKTGSFTSGVVSLAANFKGYTAHAAEPWNGKNPAKAIAQYVIQALNLNEEDMDGRVYTTVTPVYAGIGSRDYGISAGKGTVHFTVRADTSERLERTLMQLTVIAEEQAVAQGLEVEFEYIEPFEANQNDAAVVDIIRAAAGTNGFAYKETEKPFRWGEDFGLFTQVYPGAMFGIGSGDDCMPLHHPAYDFPDEIIATGISMFIAIQKKAQL